MAPWEFKKFWLYWGWGVLNCWKFYWFSGITWGPNLGIKTIGCGGPCCWTTSKGTCWIRGKYWRFYWLLTWGGIWWLISCCGFWMVGNCCCCKGTCWLICCCKICWGTNCWIVCGGICWTTWGWGGNCWIKTGGWGTLTWLLTTLFWIKLSLT